MSDQDGFPYSFDPSACGLCSGICCRGSTGHVWVSEEEIEGMAAALKMDLEPFAESYLRIGKGKIALQERRVNGEYLCCFFDPFEEHCSIYQDRPSQCRSYPFWEPYREDPGHVLRECPGVILQSETGS
jgi:hypothetical protein